MKIRYTFPNDKSRWYPFHLFETDVEEKLEYVFRVYGKDSLITIKSKGVTREFKND